MMLKTGFVLYVSICGVLLLTTVSCSKDQVDDSLVSCQDRANFGDPGESKYVLPYLVGNAYYVSQSYCNPSGGHKNQLAYDFAMKIGDTICAARGGVVMEVEQDLPDTGNEPDASKHNHVFIKHPDGTIGFYAHLKQNCLFVKETETVMQGQSIALSGNSGNTGNFPHLHFGVYESWPATEGFDVAVNFRNADGPLDANGGLIKDQLYKATTY